MKVQIQNLGWNLFFEDQIPAGEWVRGRVCLQGQNHVHVLFENEKTCLAVTRGDEVLPTIGDWVLIAPDPYAERQVIFRRLERKNFISRVRPGGSGEVQAMAANIDIIFVVTSLNQELNVRRLERYVTLAWEVGVQPVALLTKSDVCENVEAQIALLAELFTAVPIHPVSAINGEGLSEVREHLGAGRTGLFVGSSGVGKSTLVNALLGESRFRTQAIREDDSKGRHTTTARHLVVLPNGAGVVIDSPGIRELQLSDVDEGVASAFPEIEGRLTQCRFRDCKHHLEPGCAIKSAIASGQIQEDRYESYQKLLREQAYLSRKTDKAAQSEERKKWKQIHKGIRQQKKLKF